MHYNKKGLLMEGAVILQMKSRFVVKWLIVYALLRGNCERL